MGTYTELVFQGCSIPELPDNIQVLFHYFFDQESELANLPADFICPDHQFFKTPAWDCIGHVSSYYFSPFALRYRDSPLAGRRQYVFLRCDIKNYHGEIELFIDWIAQYMEDCWGYVWHEEAEKPTVFKLGVESFE